MNVVGPTGTQPVVEILVVFAGLCGLLWLATGVDLDDAAMFVGADDRPQSPWQSGLALSGECLSTVTLLSLVSAIALTGYDGLMLALGGVTVLVLVVFVTARPLRAAGGHTLGDALFQRLPGRSVRLALGLVTLALCVPYLVLQLTSVGMLGSFVLGSSDGAVRSTCIAVAGVLMISLAVSGGIRGTAHVQSVKVVLLLVVMTVVAVAVLHRFGWSSTRLWAAAVQGSGLEDALLAPGAQHRGDSLGMLNRLGQSMVLASGGQLFGLALGGVAVAALGPHRALSVSAALDLGCALTIRIRLPRLRPEQFDGTPGSARGASGTVRTSLHGTRLLLRERTVRRLILAQWLPPACVAGAEGLIVAYAGGRHFAPGWYAVLMGCLPVGMLVGDLLVGRLLRRPPGSDWWSR